MSSTVTPVHRRDTSLLLLGGAVFAAGFILGSLAGAGPALAQYGGGSDGGAGGSASFGFGVPSQGFALVKGADAGAYIVNPRGEAMRVLVAINPSAPDQPDAGRTGHLALD